MQLLSMINKFPENMELIPKSLIAHKLQYRNGHVKTAKLIT